MGKPVELQTMTLRDRCKIKGSGSVTTHTASKTHPTKRVRMQLDADNQLVIMDVAVKRRTAEDWDLHSYLIPLSNVLLAEPIAESDTGKAGRQSKG